MPETVLTDPAKYFWLKSGKGLSSLRELADYLPVMPPDEFSHHVNAERNDFANWTQHIFFEPALAETMRKTRSKDEFQSVLYTFLVRYEMERKRQEKAVKIAENAVAKPTIAASFSEPAPMMKATAPPPIPQRTPTEEELIIQDPKRFAQYRDEDSKRKDALADKFDEISRRFTESLHPETPDKIAKRLEYLEERYREFKSILSEARRLGIDPLIADFTLRTVPAKLSYAKVTQAEDDFQRLHATMDDAERELKDAIYAHRNAPNAKRDVERLARGAR